MIAALTLGALLGPIVLTSLAFLAHLWRYGTPSEFWDPFFTIPLGLFYGGPIAVMCLQWALVRPTLGPVRYVVLPVAFAGSLVLVYVMLMLVGKLTNVAVAWAAILLLWAVLVFLVVKSWPR